jgi:hypothetical protein
MKKEKERRKACVSTNKLSLFIVLVYLLLFFVLLQGLYIHTKSTTSFLSLYTHTQSLSPSFPYVSTLSLFQNAHKNTNTLAND